MAYFEDYPSSPTQDDPTPFLCNPFSRYSLNTALQGTLTFFTKQKKAASYGYEGSYRFPIYEKDDLSRSTAKIKSTPGSSIGVHIGQRTVENVELRIVGVGGVFVIKLLGKERELYVVEDGGRLCVSQATTRENATKFTFQMKEGRMILVTLRGKRFYAGEADRNGAQAWDSCRSRDALWVEFITEDDKIKYGWRRPNPGSTFAWR